MGGERYQSEQFAREATQAKIAELTLRIKILEHAIECVKLSEKHAHRRLQELQGAARGVVEMTQKLGAYVPLDLIDHIVYLRSKLPHEEAAGE